MPRMTFDINDDTHRQLKELAGRYNIPQARVISLLITAEWSAWQNQPRLAELSLSRPADVELFTDDMDKAL